MNESITISIIIILILTVSVLPLSNVFATDVKIMEHNVKLKNFVNNKYFSTWIIDVSEFSTIRVNVKTSESTGLDIGIILYEKFIQWNPLNEKVAPNLQSMAVAFERNSKDISYDSRIDGRYVIMMTNDKPTILDEISIDYTKIEKTLSGGIPTEVWVVLLGIAGGAGIGIPMQQYYKNQRKNDLKNSIKRDLSEIENIMKNKTKEETDSVYVSEGEVSKITLRIYDETRVESSVLLDFDTHKAVRDAYEEIRRVIMGYAEFVDGTRRFRKEDHEKLLETIKTALTKLK